MSKAIPSRMFEDYDPPSDLVTEEGCDTLLIYLPGFKKEQLKVQLTISRLLKISGERPLGDNKYRRFQKEFRIPPNCDTKEITAKFEDGILYIRQPKLITPAAPLVPSQQPQKTAAVAPPPAPQTQPRSQQLANPPPPPPPPPSPQMQPRPHQLAPPPPPPLQMQPRPQQLAPPPPPPSQMQPRPQQLAPPSPPLPPKPQSQQLAPPPSQLPQLQSHHEGLEKEYREKSKQKQEMNMAKEETDSKDDEKRKDGPGVVEQSRQVINNYGLFRELRKLDNVKRLGVSVLMVLIIGFYISYMFKSFIGIWPEYDQEL